MGVERETAYSDFTTLQAPIPLTFYSSLQSPISSMGARHALPLCAYPTVPLCTMLNWGTGVATILSNWGYYFWETDRKKWSIAKRKAVLCMNFAFMAFTFLSVSICPASQSSSAFSQAFFFLLLSKLNCNDCNNCNDNPNPLLTSQQQCSPRAALPLSPPLIP